MRSPQAVSKRKRRQIITRKLASRSTAAGGPGADRVTTIVHDRFDRKTSETLNAAWVAGDADLTIHSGEVTTWTYDAQGHVICTVDPSGHSTQYAHDALGNVTAKTARDHRPGLRGRRRRRLRHPQLHGRVVAVRRQRLVGASTQQSRLEPEVVADNETGLRCLASGRRGDHADGRRAGAPAAVRLLAAGRDLSARLAAIIAATSVTSHEKYIQSRKSGNAAKAP